MKWCKVRNYKPTSVSVVKVLTFLDRMARSGKAQNTVKGYLTAIARRHSRVKVGRKMLSLTEMKSVQQWVKGLAIKYPTKKTKVPAWNLEVVLHALKQPPYYDKNLTLVEYKYLTQRTAFLVALTTARRAGEIRAFTASDLKFMQIRWSSA